MPGLANGEIHVLDGRTTWGARVKYVCKEDYSLMKGEGSRVCEAGGWSGNAPECVYVKCPAPEAVANAAVEKHIGDKRNFLGSKMVYECEEGHMPSGSLSRECLEGGRWSGSPPKCTYVDCGDTPELGRTLFHVFCADAYFRTLFRVCSRDGDILCSTVDGINMLCSVVLK